MRAVNQKLRAAIAADPVSVLATTIYVSLRRALVILGLSALIQGAGY
jgi:hypothetical protein